MNSRVAIVTGGGGSGCGRAIARRLALDGWAVVVCDVDDEGGMETVRLIQGDGGRAVSVHADVGVESDVRGMMALAVREYGGLTLLVNNASAPFVPGDGMDHWVATAQTEYIGTLLCTRHARGAMVTGGAIVNVASISGLWHGRRRSVHEAPAYDSAKAAVIRLTTTLADWREKFGIRVNCLAPGWIATEGPREYWESLTPEQRAEHGVPARLLSVEEVAGAVVRLATDQDLAGRVMLWWSDDSPRLIHWGDRGYRERDTP
ncbi:MAG: SDR family oxidoreductase [Acidobacteria bacterium]|nr:SDR family oxidoreductase [Acidobacteriota bacterium]